jgi:UDP-hydrolysing UDP-N-acetyl-D-glucosamine 2-epimerase
MIKVAVFTGTRAEYGLLYWLMKDIDADSELKLQLLVSGSHLSPEFGQTINVVKSMGLGLIGYADALSRLDPDMMIILGDRFEALAAAQTAMMLRIPIVHLHGGEITEGAYDDAIRHAISKLSYLHFTSTKEYRNRVIQLGEAPDRVHNVGAIGLDHLKRSTFMTLDEISVSLDFLFSKPYFLVTYHPVTLATEDPETSFQAILSALNRFPDHQVIVTYPNADDGGRKIIPLIEEYARTYSKRVLAIKSLGQTRYLSAVKYAAAVVGNSSSGVIEVPSFEVPTINIGMRQKGRLAASSVINCEASAESISEAIYQAKSFKNSDDKSIYKNPYGSGSCSQEIIKKLKQTRFTSIKSFYDIEVAK